MHPYLGSLPALLTDGLVSAFQSHLSPYHAPPQFPQTFYPGGSAGVTACHHLPPCLHKTHPSHWGSSQRSYISVTHLLSTWARIWLYSHLFCFALPLEPWLCVDGFRLCVCAAQFSSPHPSAKPRFLAVFYSLFREQST